MGDTDKLELKVLCFFQKLPTEGKTGAALTAMYVLIVILFGWRNKTAMRGLRSFKVAG